MNKKSQINQVFIYLLSIILILFAGFLVTKFITSFGKDIDNRTENKLYELIKQDYTTVYRTLGSEKVYKYRTTSDIETVCFVNEVSCIENEEIIDSFKEELKLAVESGDNIAIFDKTGIISSNNIGEFSADADGCLCIIPSNNAFTIVLENKRNQVFINKG